MPWAHEFERRQIERRARKSVRHDRPAESRWPQQPQGNGGPPRIRTNTLFNDQTGGMIWGLDDVWGAFEW